MSLLLPLSVVVNNDISWNFQVTTDGVPQDLTSFVVKTVVKAKNSTADTAALHTYTSPSAALTVTSPTQGLVTWAVPHADLSTPGIFWWRMDIVSGSIQYTVFDGPLTVLAA